VLKEAGRKASAGLFLDSLLMGFKEAIVTLAFFAKGLGDASAKRRPQHDSDLLETT
jgi:hypothetical protein